MASPFDGLKPELIWRHFEALTRIPRCSHNEAAAARHVVQWAEKLGFLASQDKVGNVVVRVPASPGKEGAPAVVLQGHLDMVGEKDSSSPHDFAKDPIRVLREGDYLTADGTTLGSDNGIGLAAAMAVAEDPDAVHGPLELLFTVAEEVGLDGAQGLEPGSVTGKIMLNLDSEEDGAVYVGCAGGADTVIDLPVERARKEGKPLEIVVGGLKGGHSGLDINTGRGNAIKVLAHLLDRLRRSAELGLVSLAGGDKHNAIPREASAVIVTDAAGQKTLEQLVPTYRDELAAMYGKTDPGVTIAVKDAAGADLPLTPAARDRFIDLILGLPHGVLAMSQAVEGLVETSTNLAVVRLEATGAHLHASTRSSVMPALAAAQDEIFAVARLASGDPRAEGSYPGWQPDMDSPLLKRAIDVYTRVRGAAPEIKAIHAGLECGIIGEKFGGMDMLSFGPQIENPHSPSEQIRIDTVDFFYRFLKELLNAQAA
jgi:dipeptidase D